MYQTVYAPSTIVKEIKLLEPGHFLEFRNGTLRKEKYYDINRIEEKPEQNYEQIKRKVGSLLIASVERRMISDVPYGAFLSGGIDSSAVVAMMRKITDRDIHTFHVDRKSTR